MGYCCTDCARENFARQTESLCNCGSTLRHRSCGVEWSVVLYRDGAVFENSGAHNHSKYTHLLTIKKNKKPQLQGFVSKQPIALRTLEDEDNVNIDSIDSDEGAYYNLLLLLHGVLISAY